MMELVLYGVLTGDQFDSFSRNLLVPDGFPLEIIDEIDNLNPAILHARRCSLLWL